VSTAPPAVAGWDESEILWAGRKGNPAYLAHYVSNGQLKLYRYALVVGQAIARCAMTPNGRLIVTMPPQHGKSTLASVYGPLWLLEAAPHLSVILASYGHRLARRV
jgi:hypothetical protein